MAQLGFDASKHTPYHAPDGISEQPRDNTRRWSPLQTAIFDYVEKSKGNAIVEAVAGSGKSTTIVEALKRVYGSSIFLAFNKDIAEELKSRGVNARTFHSLTYSAVTKFKNARTVEGDKLRKLCQQNLGMEDFQIYNSFICKLVGLGRQIGIGCLVPDVPDVWINLCAHHNIEPESEAADLGRAIELASELLRWSNESHMVDFDDLLYLAVKETISLPKFDVVFVDEAQDTNAIQRALLRKIMHPRSRIIAVGDPCQAIYGFRGADSESMNLIAKEFNCVALPLSITYRCPTSIVAYAKQWVDHIQPAPGAEVGFVGNYDTEWNLGVFKPNDLVLCRKTAPLLTLAFRFLRARLPVMVLGREIGQGLKSLIARMGTQNIDELATKLSVWREREVQKARARNEDAKVEAIEDKVGAILCLIDSMQEDGRSVGELVRSIDMLFADKANAVILATIHKSKGLEADRVFWLGRGDCPAQWAKQPWQKQQEVNLCYVATTRAKKELYFIEETRGNASDDAVRERFEKMVAQQVKQLQKDI